MGYRVKQADLDEEDIKEEIALIIKETKAIISKIVNPWREKYQQLSFPAQKMRKMIILKK